MNLAGISTLLVLAAVSLAQDGPRRWLIPAALAQPAPDVTGAPAPPDQGADAVELGEPEAVIAPGQEELLADILGKGATLAGDCKLTAGEIEYTAVKATYACPGGEVVLVLVHPGQAELGATQTDRFAISQKSGSAPEGLVADLTSRIRAREAGFNWTLLARPRKPFPTGLAAGAAGLVILAVVLWVRRRTTRSRSPR